MSFDLQRFLTDGFAIAPPLALAEIVQLIRPEAMTFYASKYPHVNRS